jgi:hypothetical protein
MKSELAYETWIDRLVGSTSRFIVIAGAALVAGGVLVASNASDAAVALVYGGLAGVVIGLGVGEGFGRRRVFREREARKASDQALRTMFDELEQSRKDLAEELREAVAATRTAAQHPELSRADLDVWSDQVRNYLVHGVSGDVPRARTLAVLLSKHLTLDAADVWAPLESRTAQQKDWSLLSTPRVDAPGTMKVEVSLAAFVLLLARSGRSAEAGELVRAIEAAAARAPSIVDRATWD